MSELGFPGWVQVDATSDEVEGQSRAGETTQRLAQTLSPQPAVSSPELATSRTVSDTSDYQGLSGSSGLGSTSTSGTTSSKTSPIEISPTLPFTGGQTVRGASGLSSTALYDPDLPGECVFQSMLWCAGYDTTWECCTAARATVATVIAVHACLPSHPLLQNLLGRRDDAGTCPWGDPVTRFRCVLEDGDVLLTLSYWLRLGISAWMLSLATRLWSNSGLRCVARRTQQPDLTEEEGIEPNPGPPKAASQNAGSQNPGPKNAPRPPSQPSGKASNKRKAAVVKKLLQLGVDFTAHQLRTLVSADGACDRLEAAQSGQQSKDILNALYLKSDFKKEEPHPEIADDLPTVKVEVSEDVEMGFQVKLSLMPAGVDKPDTTKGLQGPQGTALRASMLRLLQSTVHPVAQTALSPWRGGVGLPPPPPPPP
eukprot:5776120-Amphidinium_carterae.4